jgi:cysteinyl-tRNA synthetase
VPAKLRLYNSMSRALEELEPLEPGRVSVYACGPTVYDYAHIGNFRFNVWVDILHRVLEWAGYDVTLVMNITDVDDKTIAGARKTGETLARYTGRFTEAFFDDLRTLGIKPATCYPRATEHIDEMVALVQRLLERGLAYQQDGSVFFRVNAFPGYGKLSGLDPDELRATGRVEGDAYEKEDVRDFALWKAAKDGEPSWDTPLGKGRPGWHLECSAMSMKYLGETFDLHVGGVDLKFPHHENEIAQSVGATSAGFARCWLHCAHLIVDGTKMSKSLGNQYTLRDLLDAGHDPVAVRYLLASVNYRKQLNFTFAALAQARAAVTRLREAVVRLEADTADLPDSGPGEARAALHEAEEGFAAALADDLNTSGALGRMFTLVKTANTLLDERRMGRDEATAVLAWLREIDAIWGVLPAEKLVERQVEAGGKTLLAIGPPMSEADIELVVARMQARAARDFAAADALRAQLLARGVTVEDTARGARWHLDAASG